MTSNRSALKQTLLSSESQGNTEEVKASEESNDVQSEVQQDSQKPSEQEEIINQPAQSKQENVEKKRRRGRPATSHKVTKIHLLLEKRGLTRKDLHDLIESKYPDEPISPDAVSRIVSGRRQHYSTNTLYRICGALNVTPNQVLDYEDEI